MVGQRLGLHVVVCDNFPIARLDVFDDVAPLQRQLGIERAAGRHAGALVFVEHAPHADAVPILAPGPVGIVVELARNLVCDHLNRILAGIGPPRVHWLHENHANGIGQLRFLGLSEENCVKYCRWWLRNSR